ncbi:MAG TPA: hypothetical protein VGM92_01315 [Candidatus Kapabacteria bacterium]|jgi:hypothetical protein
MYRTTSTVIGILGHLNGYGETYASVIESLEKEESELRDSIALEDGKAYLAELAGKSF